MRRQRKLTGAVIAIVVALGYQFFFGDGGKGGEQLQAGPTGAIEAHFEAQRSNEIVVFEGRVDRTLSDDLEGSRHQRFVVRLDSGHTVLIAHNIDLAPRVPLREGDRVEIQGEYEWNDRGGVVHWTHHDPAGRHPGGWIRWNGEKYE